MNQDQYEEMLDNLVSIPAIIDRLIHEQMQFMYERNVRPEELDCRIYIDHQSLNELRRSIWGNVTAQAMELASHEKIQGFKVYSVGTNQRLLDVVVRKK